MQRITDAEAEQILRGATPMGRPDLAPLVHAVADFRATAQHAAPTPSAALLARLDGSAVFASIEQAAASPDCVDSRSGGVATVLRRGATRLAGGVLGLGVGGLLLLGAGGAATAATAAIVGVGFAGGLPASLQEGFDLVTGQEQSSDLTDSEGDGSGDPSTLVGDGADATSAPSDPTTEDGESASSGLGNGDGTGNGGTSNGVGNGGTSNGYGTENAPSSDDGSDDGDSTAPGNSGNSNGNGQGNGQGNGGTSNGVGNGGTSNGNGTGNKKSSSSED